MTVELDDTEFGVFLLAIIGIVVAFPALAGVEPPARGSTPRRSRRWGC